jgi:hypothetical protein
MFAASVGYAAAVVFTSSADIYTSDKTIMGAAIKEARDTRIQARFDLADKIKRGIVSVTVSPTPDKRFKSPTITPTPDKAKAEK